MVEGRRAPTNAAKIRVPFIPLEWHARYVRKATEKLKAKLNPDTSQPEVQVEAVKKLRRRRVVEKVEAVAGTVAVAAAAVVVLAAGEIVIPAAVAATGVALAVDAGRRAFRDRRFGLNKSREEFGQLERAEAGPAVRAAAERVARADKKAIAARAGVEAALIDVVSTTGESARAEAVAEVEESAAVTPTTGEPAKSATTDSVIKLHAAIGARDATAKELQAARTESARITAAAGGAVAERRRLTDAYHLERRGRLRVRLRADRLARLAQRVWEDSKKLMNDSGSVQGTAEGIAADSRAAHATYRELRRHHDVQRRSVPVDASTASVIAVENDNQPDH